MGQVPQCTPAVHPDHLGAVAAFEPPPAGAVLVDGLRYPPGGSRSRAAAIVTAPSMDRWATRYAVNCTVSRVMVMSCSFQPSDPGPIARPIMLDADLAEPTHILRPSADRVGPGFVL